MSNIVRISNKILRIGGKIVNDLTPYTPPPEPPHFDPTIVEVQIGDQIWMANDLNGTDGGEGVSQSGSSYSYTYNAAVRLAEQVDGWRLPTFDDYYQLYQYVSEVRGSTSTGVLFESLATVNGWMNTGPSYRNFTGFNGTPEYISFTQQAYVRYWYTRTSDMNSFTMGQTKDTGGGIYGYANLATTTNTSTYIKVRLIKDN